MRARLLIYVFTLIFIATPSQTYSSIDMEGLSGEILEFRIRWGMIPAGSASLAVVPDDGGVMHLRATARSLPVLDYIYPVRNFMESTVHRPGISVSRYYKKVKEGWGSPREEEVVFDLEKGLARHFKNGHLRREVHVPKEVQDPLSCLYWYRLFPAQDDRVQVSLDISDGSKIITGTVSVLGRETIQTPAGTFNTILVEPKMEGIGGVFKKSPGARILIWMTDDEWRIPVKLTSEVVIGHFTVELTKLHVRN